METILDSPVDKESTLEYAGFWLRFLAFLLDSIVVGIAIFLLIGAAVAMENYKLLDSLSLFFLVGGWLYFALMESSGRQATLGKIAVGIKVIALNGEKITFGKASGRYFGKILSMLIFYVGYIMAAFTERKQTLHDMMSGCLIIVNRIPK